MGFVCQLKLAPRLSGLTANCLLTHHLRWPPLPFRKRDTESVTHHVGTVYSASGQDAQAVGIEIGHASFQDGILRIDQQKSRQSCASRGRAYGPAHIANGHPPANALRQATHLIRTDLKDSRQWDDGSPGVVGTFLQDKPPSVVAELPFEFSLQFRSALAAPRHWRVNPFKPDFPTPTDQPFVAWLKGMGDGRWEEGRFSQTDVAASGVEWIFFDPARCQHARGVDPAACQRELPERLQGALGAPAQTLEKGVLVWQLTPTPGAAQALIATCKGPIPMPKKEQGKPIGAPGGPQGPAGPPPGAEGGPQGPPGP